jgi:fumarate hydratase class II
VPRFGYDAAARLANLAHAEGKTIREIALRETALKPEELDRLLDADHMTRGGWESP